MARRKNAPDAIRVKNGLSERLRQLRTEFFGERGGPDQARKLGIPVRTWYNYENGVTVPAEIILRIVEMTSVEPTWLLRGEGPKFRSQSSVLGSDPASLAKAPVKDLLRVAIERLEEQERSQELNFGPPIFTGLPDGSVTDDPSVGNAASGSIRLDDSVARKAYRHCRVEDDAMIPIVAQGATVTYGDAEPISESFHEKMVVAIVDNKPIVRWYQHCGRFGLLKAENANANPPSILVELGEDRDREIRFFHRVLWISTPH